MPAERVVDVFGNYPRMVSLWQKADIIIVQFHPWKLKREKHGNKRYGSNNQNRVPENFSHNFSL
jgi:hypothetical protein